jgi:hypothetical protein
MKFSIKLFFLFLLLRLSSTIQAQSFTPQILYPEADKRIESILSSSPILQTNDHQGNYYICYSFKGTFSLKGQTFEGFPNKNTLNYLLIKFNVNGEVVWTQHFLTPIASLAANNGELFLTGSPDSNFTIAPTYKDSITLYKCNSFVARMDSLGAIKWMIYGSGENYLGFSKIACNSNNVFVSINLIDTFWIKTPSQNQMLSSASQHKTGIIKLDKEGNILWNRLNLTGTNPFILDIIATPNNVFFTGFYKGTFSMPTNIGNTIFLQEYLNTNSTYLGSYDMNGNIIWLNRLRTENGSKIKFTADSLTNDLYISGIFNNQLTLNSSIIISSAMIGDIYLLKINPSGNLAWTKNITSNRNKTLGHISIGNSGIYLAGGFIIQSGNSINFGDPTHPENYISGTNNSNNTNGFVASYKPNGSLNFTRQIIGSGNSSCFFIFEKDSQNINCLAQCQARENTFFNHTSFPIFTGKGADNDLYLWKLNKDGIIQKVESYETLKDGASEILCSKIDAEGNLYAAGYFNSNIFLGNTRLPGDLGEDAFLVKYNKHGKLIWYKLIGGRGNDRINDLVVYENKVVIIGNFSQTIVFPKNPGMGQNLTLSATANLDVFCASLDTSGNPLWAIKLSGNGNDRGTCISYYQDKLYLGGSFESTLFLANSNISLITAGAIDGFITCIGLNGNIIWGKRIGGTFDDEVLSLIANQYGLYCTGYFSDVANFSTPSTPFQNIVVSEGSTDGFVSSFSHSGNLQWQKRFGGNLQDIGNSITASGQRLYIAGYFTNYAGFNTVGDTSSNFITAAYASQDGFAAAYTIGGENLWQRRMGGSLYDFTKQITYHQHQLYICGYYFNNFSIGRFAADTTLLFSAEKSPYPLSNYEDAFVSIFDTLGNNVWATRAGGMFRDRANTLSCYNNQVSVGGFFCDSANFNQPSNYNTHKVSGGLNSTTKAFITNYLPLIQTNETDSMYCLDSKVIIKVQQNGPVSDSTLFTIELGNDSSLFHQPIQLFSWYGLAPASIQINLPASLTESRLYKIRTIAHTPNQNISESPNWFKVILAKPPIVADTQSFCFTGKILNLHATGNQLKWYENDSSTQVLTNEHPLQHNKYYYATQADRNCISSLRSKVWVELKSVSKPSGDSLQNFCYQAKLNDLLVFGSNLKWYQDSTYNNIINTDQNILHLKPYFISQTIDDCESKERLIVKGNITLIDKNISKSDTQLWGNPNYTHYQWLNCDSNMQAIAGANEYFLKPTASGNYALRISHEQCMDTSLCVNITISSNGVNEHNSLWFRFEPNPASNKITLQVPERLIDQQVILYDAKGIKRKDLNLTSIQMNLDVSELEPGLYFIAIPHSGLAPKKLIKDYGAY